MSERFKEHAWKACELQGSEGSNPSLSAKFCSQSNIILIHILFRSLFLNICFWFFAKILF